MIWGYVKPNNALASDPNEGACSAPPDPLAEISNILFEIITEMLWKKQFWTYTSIYIILDCIKELFMLLITLCTACFFRAKINKNLWPPTFRFSPPLFWMLWRRHCTVKRTVLIFAVVTILTVTCFVLVQQRVARFCTWHSFMWTWASDAFAFIRRLRNCDLLTFRMDCQN